MLPRYRKISILAERNREYREGQKIFTKILTIFKIDFSNYRCTFIYFNFADFLHHPLERKDMENQPAISSYFAFTWWWNYDQCHLFDFILYNGGFDEYSIPHLLRCLHGLRIWAKESQLWCKNIVTDVCYKKYSNIRMLKNYR